MRYRIRGRWWTTAAAIVAGLALALTAPPGPALADPGDEGGSEQLRQALDTASKGYLDAQAAVEASRRREAELNTRAAAVEAQLAAKQSDATAIAATAYRNGRLVTAAAMLDSGGQESFLHRASTLQTVAVQNDRKIRELARLRDDLAAARAKIAAEVKLQEQQLAAMAKRKKEAEQALASVGGEATNGPEEESGGQARPATPAPGRAQPAPRRPDGSWPRESCNRNDPTTKGCLTPRTLHALNQAKSAGFTRFVSCYRPGGPYEHPKGRACDFAAQANTFGGVATGGDRAYGNNLAAYFVRNANALGVLYVIWFRQIWLPGSGWRAYRSGRGDPSSDHTNHVHLSMY
jgi:hypothetical protein